MHHPFRSLGGLVVFGVILATTAPCTAQQVDCARLQQLIAQGGGGRGGGSLRRQGQEIARTQAMMRQYGCDNVSFFGGNPQCSGLTQRLQSLEAGMAQLQAGGGGDRGDLVARYNTYCRGAAPPQQPRGFFESLFGTEERREPLPQQPPHPESDTVDDTARGGSQAVCVRACDGGFFPLGISARRGKESLVETCQALCPGAETEVFTRSPDADIKTAASLDGKPYSELPNALKFEKSFVPTCTCRQPGKSWSETLANAEEVLGASRKGDVLVTREKADELSRPRLDPKSVSAVLAKDQMTHAAPTPVSPKNAAAIAGATAGADGDARSPAIRKVGPQP